MTAQIHGTRLYQWTISVRAKLWLASIAVLLGCLINASCAGISAVSESPSQVAAVNAESIPRSFFGMHINGLYDQTPWPGVPFGSLRLWDIGVTWHNLQPQAGVWDFTRLDRIVQDAQQRNVEPLLVLGMTPTWASARPGEQSDYGMGATAEPANIDDWRNYVRTLAERYRGKIRHWELWNEANLPEYYTGNLPELLLLCKEAYTILKQIDPNNEVLTPSANSGIWLGEFLKGGGGNYADIIGFHFYHFPGTPEDLIQYFEAIKKLISDYGLGNKPLWGTEMGWGTVAPGQGPDQTFPDEHVGAEYISRTLLLSLSAGISSMHWYAWNNRGWVKLYLTEADHVTPTLAAQAYGELQAWLVGSTMQACGKDADSTFICNVKTASGTRELIVWNPIGNLQFSIPPSLPIKTATDIYGNTKQVETTVIQVGPSPVLLE